MGTSTSRGYLCDLIKNDDSNQAKKILDKHPEYVTDPLNDAKDTPGLLLACTYGSNKIINLILDMKCNPNIKKSNDGTTALMIAVKRNNFQTCLILLERGADPHIKNDIGLTAFDYSVLFCNYEISLYFKQKYKSNIKEMDYYLEQGNKIKAPMFNIKLFIEAFNADMPLEIAPQFKLTPQQNKDFSNKLPDPNETWNQFFNRVMKFEIYQPPMIEKEKIPFEKRNSLYMRMQTKLLEIEYEKKISFNDEKEKDEDIEKKDIEMKGNFHSSKIMHMNSIDNTNSLYQKNNSNSEAVVLDEEVINIKKPKSDKDKYNENNIEIALKL